MRRVLQRVLMVAGEASGDLHGGGVVRELLRLRPGTSVFGIKRLGFDTGVSTTPITPIMLGEAPLAQQFSRALFDNGVFAMAIGFPTVPKGKARIRVMISAAHSREDLDRGLEIIAKVGQELGVIK